MSAKLAVVSVLALVTLSGGACSTDPAAPRADAAPAADANLQPPPDGGPDRPGPADAPAGAADRPGDTRPGDGADAPTADGAGLDTPGDRPAADAAPISGGPGCAPGSLCRNVRIAYAEAVLAAQRCTVGAPNPCAEKVPGSLGCDGCQVWVSNRAALDPLIAAFAQGGCATCFFDSPTGDRCHPLVCPDLLRGTCSAGPGGGGSCTIEAQPRECPAAAATGGACKPNGWLCQTVSTPQRSCFCRGTEWSCF